MTLFSASIVSRLTSPSSPGFAKRKVQHKLQQQKTTSVSKLATSSSAVPRMSSDSLSATSGGKVYFTIFVVFHIILFMYFDIILMFFDISVLVSTSI